MRRVGEDADYDGQVLCAQYVLVLLLVGFVGYGLADLLGLVGI